MEVINLGYIFAVRKLYNKARININMAQVNDQLTENQYKKSLEYIKTNIAHGDIPHISRITGLTPNYIWMVINSHRTSEMVVRIAERYIAARQQLITNLKPQN